MAESHLAGVYVTQDQPTVFPILVDRRRRHEHLFGLATDLYRNSLGPGVLLPVGPGGLGVPKSRYPIEVLCRSADVPHLEHRDHHRVVGCPPRTLSNHVETTELKPVRFNSDQQRC